MNFFKLSDNDGHVISLDQILDYHLTFEDHILIIRYAADEEIRYYYKDEVDARTDYRRILNQ
jgi:hypothetical protein